MKIYKRKQENVEIYISIYIIARTHMHTKQTHIYTNAFLNYIFYLFLSLPISFQEMRTMAGTKESGGI